MYKKGLMFLLILMFLLFANNVLADGYEFVGGYYYLTFDPELNDYIEEYNQTVQEIIEADESWGTVFSKKEVNDLKELKSTTGYYIGISTKLENIFSNAQKGFTILGQYESFSDNNTGDLYTEWTDGEVSGTTEGEVDAGIDISGFYSGIAYRLNDYLSVNGGLGYYEGELKNKGYIKYSTNPVPYAVDNDTDLEGTFGYKVGAAIDYPLTDNIKILCTMNYRFLEMKLREKIEMTEEDDGFDIDISSMDLSGFDLELGLSYAF